MKFLSSVKLTIILLVLIVAASIVGTIIPQNWTDQQYASKYGAASRLLIGLQFTSIYHSYWYMALLVALCVNLCACSLQNFGPLMKSLSRPNSAAMKVEIDKLPFYRELRLSRSIAEVESKIRGGLARSLYRLRYAETEEHFYYFERGKVSRFGPMMTHASIIIILVAGIFVSALGFKEYSRIPVGGTLEVAGSDFQVRVDDFKAEFYPESHIPKEYTSALTVIENGVPVHKKTIEVNHPMKYKGVKFYQSGYGLDDTVQIELVKGEADPAQTKVLGRLWIKEGELFQMPGSQVKIKVVAVFPDFVMDMDSGQVGTRSREPRNPALLLELYEGDEVKDRLWSFLGRPAFHGSQETDYSVKFLSVRYYTELQISRDPGINGVWIGSLLMTAGLFLSFYMSHKRVWIKLSAENDETVVKIGARSYKNRSGFDREIGSIRKSLGLPGGDEL